MDAQGRKVKGYISAPSKATGILQLKEQGLELLSVRHQWLARYRLKLLFYQDEMIQLFLYLEYALKTGETLVDILQHTATGFSENFSGVLNTLWTGISRGRPFSEVGKTFPGLFDPIILGLIRMGEHSGKFATVCEKIRLYLCHKKTEKQTLIKVLFYPLTTFFCFIGVCIFFSVYILPEVVMVFQANQTPLPMATEILLGLFSQASFFYFLWITTLWIILYIIYRIFFQYLSNIKDYIFFHYFPLGPFFCQRQYNKFLEAVFLLYDSKMPLLECLKIARSTVKSLYLKEKIDELCLMIREGSSFSKSLNKLPLFNDVYHYLLQVGEKTSHLRDALKHVVAVSMEQEKNTISRLNSLLGPMIFFLVGAGLGLLIAGTLTPLYDCLGENVV